MFNENEFGLLCDTFKKSRVGITAASLRDLALELMDESVRPFFSDPAYRALTLGEAFGPLQSQVLYRFRDPLQLSYLVFLLTDFTDEVVIVGPYLEGRPDKNRLLELSEKSGFNPRVQRAVEDYLNLVPDASENRALLVLLESFCERMWGRHYDIVDIHRELMPYERSIQLTVENDAYLDMHTMEQRYALENDIMDAIAHGAEQRVVGFFQDFTGELFESRLSDPLRNSKNYCIIMNTLFRKAAEQGGVHPIYLDQLSSQFAARIEQLPSLEKLKALMLDMCVGYCKLVRKHAARQYSPLVQKAVVMIEGDPSAELTLHYLAGKLNVSNAYLSAAFKKETGLTVTAYIRKTRMALARRLLRHTNLQVQTVALHCGIVDVQYFSKLFKEDTGKTPTQFRLEGEKA